MKSGHYTLLCTILNSEGDRATRSSKENGQPVLSDMRKPRIIIKDALYHVTARANRQEMILDSGHVKDLFLETVRRAKKKYDFRIENFCVMGNHIHLMIRPGKEQNLSAIMQWILSVFAMAYNKRKGLTGHVWGSRFFSRIVNGLREFLAIFSYIDSNPVEANQVSDKRNWLHGGLRHHRTGLSTIVDGTADIVSLCFPEHGQLCLCGKS